MKTLRAVALSLFLGLSLLATTGCSAPKPDCRNVSPTHELPKELSALGIPFDENSKLCDCLQPGDDEFIVSLSHADPGTLEQLFQTYKTKFEGQGYKLATAKETEKLIKPSSPQASTIQEYFYKGDLMIGCKVEKDIVNKKLSRVTLRNESDGLIVPDFDVDSAKKTLGQTFQKLIESVDKSNPKEMSVIEVSALDGRPVLFQMHDLLAKGPDQYSKSELAQLTKKYKAAEIIALVKNTPIKTSGSEKVEDLYREDYDEEGRKVTYFKGHSRSGRVYFILKDSAVILGVRDVSASNSNVTSDPGKDLLDNYYNKIEDMEAEFKAIDRRLD